MAVLQFPPPKTGHSFFHNKGHVAILQGDVRETLRQLPDACIHCVVTSPPYYRLRDYQTGEWSGGDPGCEHVVKLARWQPARRSAQASATCSKCGAVKTDQQLGLESTVDEYVQNLVLVMREVRRVLRDDGTVWFNIGDRYASEEAASSRKRKPQHGISPHPHDNIKPKDKMLVPFRVALAFQNDGWWVRQDNIWAKPVAIPDSTEDRTTCSHEYVFHLTKSPRYFYDQEAIREEVKPGIASSWAPRGHSEGLVGPRNGASQPYEQPLGANRRDVWTIAVGDYVKQQSVWVIPTEPYASEHAATFPELLPLMCIKAGTSRDGSCPRCGTPYQRVVLRESRPNLSHLDTERRRETGLRRMNDMRGRTDTGSWKPGCTCNAGEPVPCVVLDPFAGHGTTAIAAARQGCNVVLCELSRDYVASIQRRLKRTDDIPVVGISQIITEEQNERHTDRSRHHDRQRDRSRRRTDDLPRGPAL